MTARARRRRGEAAPGQLPLVAPPWLGHRPALSEIVARNLDGARRVLAAIGAGGEWRPRSDKGAAPPPR
jgi:hypothetical protein